MSNAVTTSRHRADVPATPVSNLADAVSAHAATLGRRGAVVAAAGGLLVTMGMPASATEAHHNAPATEHHAAHATQHSDKSAAPNQALKVDATPRATAAGLKFKADAAPKPAPKPASKPAPTTADVQSASHADSRSDAVAHTDSSSNNSEATTSAKTKSATTTPSSTATSTTTNASTSNTSGSAAAGSTTASTASSAKGSSIVSIAAKYTGVPYVSGGKTPSGWDCSGYVSYVYKKAGKSIPSQSSAIHSAGKVVSASNARPGDVIWSPGHVGIYAGHGKMYDAGNSRVDTSKRSFSWMGNVTFLRF